MASFRMCSWCHSMNPTTAQYCSQCGHEAQKPRMLCRCPKCQGWRQIVSSAELAETIERLAEQFPKERPFDAND